MLGRWPPHNLHRMFEALPALVAAADSSGENVAARAVAWLGAHPLERGERKLAQARERLEINVAFRRRVAGQLATALGRSA